MPWITPQLWRHPDSQFHADEPLQCSQIYTASALSAIHAEGFDGIWLRGRLWELIRTQLYPQLNDPLAAQRLQNLRELIMRAADQGVQVFLFFNEPSALPKGHDFWHRHPELAGEPYCEPDGNREVTSFCTSTPGFRQFFHESLSNLFHDLRGLGGVILITASEFQTHCWSHRARRPIGDAYIDRCLVEVACPRCRHREPAAVVGELVQAWVDTARTVTPTPRVWVWNWSWSMWYHPPQQAIFDALPDGVSVMCDFERGGSRDQLIGRTTIDEYSLGYVGPSEQFQTTAAVASARGLPVCAKLQIGTTHELATVPNLPLIPNLYDKLQWIDKHRLAGLMCSWCFGNTSTLNTAAFGLYANAPTLRHDKTTYLATVATRYFGDVDTSLVLRAWTHFCEAFAQYPFSLPMLYFSPMNYAVAYPLRLRYDGQPMGPSWIPHSPWGDRLEDCLGGLSFAQAHTCFVQMERIWEQGLQLYEKALGQLDTQHSREELSCAKMIGCHLRAMRHIVAFHRQRQAIMAENGLPTPCALPETRELRDILTEHRETARQAWAILQRDARLGYHQEPHARLYDADALQQIAAG